MKWLRDNSGQPCGAFVELDAVREVEVKANIRKEKESNE